MSDYTLPPCSTLVCGMTGSGKTTFALRYLLNAPAACRFIFDDLGQASLRLKLPAADCLTDLEGALATRWVLFNPHRMFPGDVDAAFRFFCGWVFSAAQRGPGKKILMVDEVWRFCSPHAIPRELAMVAQAGRAEHLELLTCTQLPHKINASISGQCTELVTFRLDEPLAISKAAELGRFPEKQLLDLPLGTFLAKNRLSGGQTTGKLF